MASWGPFDISGKNVIVTGAAMGIGFGIAKRFVEGGANVLLNDIDESALHRAADRLRGGPGSVRAVLADIADDDGPMTIVARAINELGSVDVLVNNAGIFPQVPMLQMTREMWDRVLRINLRGLAFLCQAAGQRMVDQGHGGRIINIGSIDSLHPSMVGLAAYDASKGGVLMFTRNFAVEMAPHQVLVNAILPGGVSTEGTERPLEGSGLSVEETKAMQARFVEQVPLRRMGNPDDIAKVAVFLASPAASYMTGAAVVVDGGMLLS